MDNEESFSNYSFKYFSLVFPFGFFLSFFIFLAWKPLLARYNSTFRKMFIVNQLHLFHSDIDITGTDHSDSSSNSSATESSAESEDDNCFL